MNKKFICVILAAVLVLSLLTGCGGEAAKPQPSEEPSAEVSEAVSEAPVEETPDEEAPVEEVPVEEAPQPMAYTLPLTDEEAVYSVFTTMSPMISSLIESPADITAWQELMRVTGITLQFQTCSPDVESSQLLLMVLGGDCTDVLPNMDNNYTGGIEQAIADDVIIDVGDLIDENCPNYLSILKSNDLYDYCFTGDGCIGGFVRISNYAELTSTGLVIRQDMLDKLNAQPPATVSQLHDVLAEMKTEFDSDYPLWISSDCFIKGDFLLDSFGAATSLTVEDGKVTYGYASDGMKEYLSTIKDWYDEGLIYTDFYSGEYTDACKEYALIASDDITVFPTGAVDIGNYASYSDDPDFRIVAMPDVSLDDGGSIYTAMNKPKLSELRVVWSISSTCENPELLCNFVDFLFTDEGCRIANYGVEGDTYTINENGKPVFTEKISGAKGKEYVQALLTSVLDAAPYLQDWYRGTETYTDDMLASYEIWASANYDFSHALPRGFRLSGDDATEYSNIISDIDTYVDEMLIKFVLGYESFDNWDAYVQTVNSMRIGDALAIYQSAYDEYMAG